MAVSAGVSVEYGIAAVECVVVLFAVIAEVNVAGLFRCATSGGGSGGLDGVGEVSEGVVVAELVPAFGAVR
mgnify:FL=1